MGEKSKLKVSRSGSKVKAKKTSSTDKFYKKGSVKITPRKKVTKSAIYGDNGSRVIKKKSTNQKSTTVEKRTARDSYGNGVTTTRKTKVTPRKTTIKRYSTGTTLDAKVGSGRHNKSKKTTRKYKR